MSIQMIEHNLLNLPDDMLEKEAFKTLPAKEKEEYVSNVLKKILELNPNGITISQIKEHTGFAYSTIWHHLEILKCTAQSRKISRGNLDVYYPAGKVKHLKKYSKDRVHYSLSAVENDEGNFVCIHETRKNKLGNYTVCRGIAIPFELTGDFIETLKKAKIRRKAKK